MKLKNLILSSVVAGSALLAAGTANAYILYGELVQTWSGISGGVSYTYGYVRASNYWTVPANIWWVRTTNPSWGDRLSSSLHKQVYIYTDGNGSSGALCPAGALSYCGNINWFYNN